MTASGVYMIINIVNNKRYIGSSVNMKTRLYHHRRLLDMRQHHCIKLQNAWNKHGSNDFSFEVVEFVENKSMLADREQYWMDHYQSFTNAGYNIKPKAYSNVGHVLSQATKDKISAKHKGKKIPSHLAYKWAAARIGKKHSQETIEKMRIARAKRVMSDETKRKLSEYRTGRALPESTRAAMSRAHLGRTQSPDHIAKRVAKQLGQKRSLESLQRISESQILRMQTNPINRNAKGQFVKNDAPSL